MWPRLPNPTPGLLSHFCALCAHPECLLVQALDTGADDLLTCSLPFTCKSQGLLSTGPAWTPTLHSLPLSLTHRWWMDGQMDMDRWMEGHNTQGHQLDTTNWPAPVPWDSWGVSLRPPTPHPVLGCGHPSASQPPRSLWPGSPPVSCFWIDQFCTARQVLWLKYPLSKASISIDSGPKVLCVVVWSGDRFLAHSLPHSAASLGQGWGHRSLSRKAIVSS